MKNNFEGINANYIYRFERVLRTSSDDHINAAYDTKKIEYENNPWTFYAPNK